MAIELIPSESNKMRTRFETDLFQVGQISNDTQYVGLNQQFWTGRKYTQQLQFPGQSSWAYGQMPLISSEIPADGATVANTYIGSYGPNYIGHYEQNASYNKMPFSYLTIGDQSFNVKLYDNTRGAYQTTYASISMDRDMITTSFSNNISGLVKSTNFNVKPNTLYYNTSISATTSAGTQAASLNLTSQAFNVQGSNNTTDGLYKNYGFSYTDTGGWVLGIGTTKGDTDDGLRCSFTTDAVQFTFKGGNYFRFYQDGTIQRSIDGGATVKTAQITWG
jgi:hypothetical protein